MFCPKCSEPKASDETVFCIKCGTDLGGLADFLTAGRRGSTNGILQGVLLLMVGVLLIPVWMFVGMAFPPNDRLVESAISTTMAEAVSWILMWIAFLAGAARIAYAFGFENGGRVRDQGAASITSSSSPAFDRRASDRAADDGGVHRGLPSGDAFEAARPGKWKTTDELLEPVLRKAKTSGEL